ncbi:MAG: response regulator [bacterium]
MTSPTKKILIVDDEEIIVDILKRRFERMGFTVASEFNGQDCIRRLQEDRFDVVVCDIKMPEGINGLEVLQIARSQNPEVKFVAMSGHLFPEDYINEMKMNGAAMFFKKPFYSVGKVTQQIADLVLD